MAKNINQINELDRSPLSEAVFFGKPLEPNIQRQSRLPLGRSDLGFARQLAFSLSKRLDNEIGK